ncbi:35995_t:CDS:2, partial [Gigaspora margarita]
MAKQQKKQKLYDIGDNKKNMFYNSLDTLNNSLLLEYLHNNNSFFWDEKVEFERSALKDTTNIWNNSTITQPLEVTKTTQEQPKSTNNSELILDTAYKRIDDNTPHKKTQTQATMELLDKEINQVIMGLNSDTNSSEMEMIDPTENRLTSLQVTETGALDPEVNTSVPQATSNTVTQHQESYLPEMTTKDTLSEDAEWLSFEGFIPVVNKRSTGSKKNKLIDKSKTAILASNRTIEFKSTEIDMDNRVIRTEFLVKGHTFAITNVYVPHTNQTES